MMRRGNSKVKLLIGAGIIIFGLFKYYSNSEVNEFTGKKQHISLSPEQEISLGLQSAPHITQQHGGLYPDQKYQEFVDKVGQKLVNNSVAQRTLYKYDFHLLRDSKTINAFALPGGQMDKTDTNIQATALRETFEEVGVYSDKIQVVGEITQVYIPPSKFLVTPFIGVMDEYPSFVKDDFEVAEVLEVPVSLLFNDGIIKSGPVSMGKEGYTLKVPYFDIFGHKVWGATAIMLSEFKAIMK